MHLPHLKQIEALVPTASHPSKGAGRAENPGRIAPVSAQGGGGKNPNRAFEAPEQDTAEGAPAPEADVAVVGTETATETMLAHLMEHDLEVAATEAPRLDAAALEARERYAETVQAA